MKQRLNSKGSVDRSSKQTDSVDQSMPLKHSSTAKIVSEERLNTNPSKKTFKDSDRQLRHHTHSIERSIASENTGSLKSKPTHAKADPAKDMCFLEESSMQEDELVRFGIDMSKLSDYLDNIIRVVNQHAKLLDDVSTELAKRPEKNETGELFSLLSMGFPYEQSLKLMGASNHITRQQRVLERLSMHQVDVTTKLSEQQE
jgi:hypothetical protein